MKLQDILCRIGLHKWRLHIEYFTEIFRICTWCKRTEVCEKEKGNIRGKWTKV